MNKEEILARSRSENKNKDIVEMEALQKGCRAAFVVGTVVCMALCAAQMIVNNTVNWGCWVVDFSILSTVFLVKYIKLRKKHELAMTIFYFLCAAFFLTGYIMALRG